MGWGIGVANALVMYTSVVWHATGPGFLPAPACPHISLFYISGYKLHKKLIINQKNLSKSKQQMEKGIN
jgi:hypothetical protein